MVGLLFVLVFVLLFGLFSMDNAGISTIDNVHEYIKEKQTISKEELIKKLGTDYKIHDEGTGIFTPILKRYVWMKHAPGIPVRFLTVYFDENECFVKHTFSIGWKDVE
jgi:hypothetical protein